jgi:hypothetical protein
MPTKDTTDIVETVQRQLHARLLDLRAETARVEKALTALAADLPHRAKPDAAIEAKRARWRAQAAKQRKQKAAKPRRGKAAGYTLPNVVGPDGKRKVLRDWIREVLVQEPEGLDARTLTERVVAAGWPTTSPQPHTVVFQELSGERTTKHYRRDDSGRWSLRDRSLATAS